MKVILHHVLFFCVFISLSVVADSSSLTKIGWIETVKLLPEDFTVQAKIDTGADNSSLDVKKWESFQHEGKEWVRFIILNNQNDQLTLERPLERFTRIKRKQGEPLKRPVVDLLLCIGQQQFHAPVNLSKRDNFKYRMLIGRSFLKQRFLVDSGITQSLTPECTH